MSRGAGAETLFRPFFVSVWREGCVDTVDVRASGTSGHKIQIRKPRADQWTKAKRNAFLDHLAATCNVTHSSAKVGIATSNAYALRRRDAAFAEAWSAALEQGYEHIEAQLLARAIGQDADPLREGDPSAVPFDPEMGLRVMAARKGGMGTGRPRGPAGVKRVTITQVEASLRRKLDALAKRLAPRGSGGEGA